MKAVAASWPLILGIIIMNAVLGFILLPFFGRSSVVLFAGIIIGALLSELATAIDRTKRWPVLSMIIDWQKVEEIARNTDKAS